MRKFHHQTTVFLLLLLLFLSACSNQQEDKPKSDENEQETQKEETNNGLDASQLALPIREMEGSFSTVGGWLNDETILYVTEDSDGAKLFSYHLLLGTQELLYSSSHPISSVQLSPSKKYILIHSSPYSAMGMVTILTGDGKILMSSEIESNELLFEWNQVNEEQLMITSFSEDWTFKTLELDLATKKLTEQQLPQPFVNYLNENELVYLDWDTDTVELTAPLKKVDLSRNETKNMLEDIYQIDVLKDRLMTITVSQVGQESTGVYTFYDKDFSPLAKVSVPMLSHFSGWSIPYYDFSSTKNVLFTFQPMTSGEFDQYAEKYTLSQWTMDTGKQETLFEELENQPLSCSPNGSMCLYGQQLENILLLQSKEQVKVIDD